MYNHHDFARLGFAEIAHAFLLGFRFDMAAISMIFGVFFLLWCLPISKIHRGRISQIIFGIFIFLNLFFAAFNFADAELIHFNGQRLTLNYFRMSTDIEGQFLQLVYHFWFLALMVIVSTLVLAKFFPKVQVIDFHPIKNKWLKTSALLFLALFIFAFGIRGGVQNKPLREAHAYVFAQNELGHLSLNSSFTFLRSLKGKPQAKLNFYKDEEVKRLLARKSNRQLNLNWSQPQNVVVIIVESLSMEYVRPPSGQSYTPFFNELSSKGVFFTNCFANGRRSIEAIPAIFSSIPSLLNEAFLTSPYQGVKIVGLGNLFLKAGYQTAFFHGAANGSMFFDSYTQRLGFSKYYGLNEYPNRESDYDGFWGIFDEPFLQFFANELNNYREPFAAGLFTLSSHQPYTLPAAYKGKIMEGTLPIHKTVSYTDLALKNFFEKAKNSNWFKNTLFLITGDHTSTSNQPEFQNDLGYYRVPLLIYHPSVKSWPKVDAARTCQHVDIMPTVLDIVGATPEIKNQLSLIGSSLFAPDEDSFVVNRTADGFWYLSSDDFIKVDHNFNLIEPQTLPADHPGLSRLKSYLQYFVNGVLDNNLYHERR